MRSWFLTVGFLVSIMLSSISASAQSNSNSAGYAELVKLFEATKIIIRKNGAFWHADKWGVLNQNQWADVQLGALNSGWEYGLIGFCDSGCGTFDLVLYDGNNRQIARGIGKPELEVKPRQTQNYWARVSMSGCNVNPCNWGFIVAKKQLASMATPVPPSVTPARPAHAQTHNVASRRALVASTGNQTDVTAFQLNNDTNYQIAIHWIDYAGNPNPNRVISPPGNHWRISGGVKTWESHWYAIYNPSGFLCSFSPRQNTTVNLSQLAACK